MIKYCGIALVACALSGCLRVNTNPMPQFEEIASQTGEAICWNTNLDDNAFSNCIEELLKQKLTVESAVYIALLNNRNLQAMYENLGIAKAHLVQAGLLTNPIFALSWRFSTQPGITDLVDLSLLQNLLETFLIPLKKRAAAKELEATKLRVATEILEVIGQTKIAFYTLQAMDLLWDLKKKELLALECAMEVANRLFEAGNSVKLELTTKRLQYEEAKIALATLEVDIIAARERLNVLMGLWGEQICWRETLSSPPVRKYEWVDVERRVIANSLDLEIARKQLYATAAAAGIETSRIVFPQMDVGGAAEREDSIWYVGPAFALAIPFFDFGQASVAAGQADIFRQWNQLTALAIEIRSQARQRRVNVLNAARQWRHYQEVLIPLAKQTVTLTLLQHNAMQLGVLDLLDAKRQEILTQMEAIEIQKMFWIAQTELEILARGHRL